MKEKQLRDIKHGQAVVELLSLCRCIGAPFGQIRLTLGLTEKLTQKALADLVKFEFVKKLEHGYILSAKGKAEIDGQKTTS